MNATRYTTTILPPKILSAPSFFLCGHRKKYKLQFAFCLFVLLYCAPLAGSVLLAQTQHQETLAEYAKIYPKKTKGKNPKLDAFILYDTVPEPLNLADAKAKIVYPPHMVEQGIKGRVFIKLLIDKTGEVIDYRIVRTPHDSLSYAVMPALSILRFKPAVLKKKPAKAWVTIPFDFRIKEVQADSVQNAYSTQPKTPIPTQIQRTFIDPAGIISFGVGDAEGLQGRTVLDYAYPDYTLADKGLFIYQIAVDAEGKVVDVKQRYADGAAPLAKRCADVLLSWRFSALQGAKTDGTAPLHQLLVNFTFK